MSNFAIHQKVLQFILNNIKLVGDTDVFPRLFEYDLITADTIKWVSAQDPRNWENSEAIKCLTAKDHGGFRIATLLDPVDTIFFNSLVLKGAVEMEKHRIPISKNIVFSRRFKIDKSNFRFFDTGYQHSSFINRSKELSKKYKYVLRLDIADFFPRIYLHDIENAVLACSDENYKRSISRFLKNLSDYVTVGGLPIGYAGSRYLAEIVLNDLDHSLLSKGIIFCRYVDDFCIFADTEEELYKELYIVSELLSTMYHLTVQRGKTKMQTSSEFQKAISLWSEQSMHKLSDAIKNDLADLFNKDMYEPIFYDELSDKQKNAIDKLHIAKMLEVELEGEEINLSNIKRILGFSGKICSLDAFQVLVKNLDKVYPIMDAVMRYLQVIADSLDQDEKVEVADILLFMLLDSKHLSRIPFYKIWILNTLCMYKEGVSSDDRNRIIQFYEQQDSLTKRFIILLLGELKTGFWFREHASSFKSLNSWQQRAFVKGFADCEFSEEKNRPFLKSISSHIQTKDSYILSLLGKNQDL